MSFLIVGMGDQGKASLARSINNLEFDFILKNMEGTAYLKEYKIEEILLAF